MLPVLGLVVVDHDKSAQGTHSHHVCVEWLCQSAGCQADPGSRIVNRMKLLNSLGSSGPYPERDQVNIGIECYRLILASRIMHCCLSSEESVDASYD